MSDGDDPVAARRPQIVDRVLARGDADDPDPGGVPGRDVEWGVAGRDAGSAVQLAPGCRVRALEGLAGDVGALVGIRAIAAEGEVAVETGAGELDPCSRLGVAGDQTNQTPFAGQPLE